jgi:hypothetical protein
MIDPVSISALILAIISGIVVFIKGIRKCRISSKGMFLERDTQNSELSKQQEFTLKLIELLNDLPQKDEESDINSISEIIQKKTPDINNKLKNIIEILDAADKEGEKKGNNERKKDRNKENNKEKRKVLKKERKNEHTLDISSIENELKNDAASSTDIENNEKKVTKFIVSK